MRSNLYQPASWNRLSRFLTGGGLATLLHWLVMFALIFVGTDARVATATGATAGLAANYFAQHTYTFQSGIPHRMAFSRYLIGAGLGWLLNLVGFLAVYSVTGLPSVSQAAATIVAVIPNYLIAEKLVFREEQISEARR